ncbi:conserved hypothetical protein [Candidatus Methylobacter favarea]|uniref:Uncharacterized protein n=1 Tax=Candidatus Methylobacter favarea TaxID=2707345 RepID=A0A8S0XV89_9GAMM|nr:conserved hypothetical protein [Candidatus Methylobacter favarea]
MLFDVKDQSLKYLAEREGFEPSMGYKTHTPLAGERLQPLGHLSYKSFILQTHLSPWIPLALF